MTDTTAPFAPMLARTFTDKLGGQFPTTTQPKLDGVRCLAIDGKLWSRNGKLFNIPHISEATRGLALDGELYCHGKSFQEVISLVKRNRPESAALKLNVYDLPAHGSVWALRLVELRRMAQDWHPCGPLTLVDTKLAQSAADLDLHEAEALEAGYEGLIVRHLEGRYLAGKRSPDLLKLKRWQDGEFVIVDFEPGKGKFEGISIPILRGMPGTTSRFACTPPGDMAQKRAVGPQDKGKTMTVRFFGLTDGGVPRFPIGVAIRDYE